MQTRTKIAASAAAVSAGALALVLYVTTADDGAIRAPATAPTARVPEEIRPITADRRSVEEGQSARIGAFFATLERDGPTAPMYQAIREEFPQRYAEIRDTVRKEMESTSPPADPQQRIIELTREALDGFKPLVRQSSDESLRKVAAAQYALLSALAVKDPGACAQYASQGGDVSMPDNVPVMQAVSGLASVQIHAAGDAARSPQKRAAPTPAIFAELVQRMKADGITDEQVYALADSKLATLPAEEQCRVAISMYHSALGLAPKDAGVLLAAIIRS